MGVEKDEKTSYFHNGVEVKPSGIETPEGKKRLWIPKHRMWVYVPIEEPDEEAIDRVTKKFNNRINFEIPKNAKSKD